jgi:hypothetical protein
MKIIDDDLIEIDRSMHSREAVKKLRLAMTKNVHLAMN